MTIAAPEPPPQVLRVLRRDLKSLADSAASIVPKERIQLTRGLAIYEAQPGAEPWIAPSPRGWRFVALRAEPLFWADVTEQAVETVLAGPAVPLILAAAAAAEAAPDDGEARVLVCPVIDAAALWLFGNGDRFWPFAPEIEPACDAATLIARWRERAERLAVRSKDALD